MKHRRILTALLTLCLVLSLTAVTAAAEETPGGTCGAEGDNLIWTLAEDGTLTISGTGAMKDYMMSLATAPWSSYKDRINTVIVEPGVTTIGNCAFFECPAIARVELPEGLLHIGEHAFYNCDGITALTLPESLETISWAFNNADGLTEITIPAAVTLLEPDCFMNCDNLRCIRVDEANGVYSSDETGTLFSKDKSLLIMCPPAYEGSYAIPEGVVTIGERAFASSRRLTAVEFPATVAEIGKFAFFTSEALSELRFLGDAPVFPEYMFNETAVTVFYPADNETWTQDVMLDYGGDLTWVAEEPVYSGTCGENATWTLRDGVLTISGTGPMDDYYVGTQEPWHDYTDSIQTIVIEDGITSVGVSAFYAPYATKAVIGKDVKVIRPHGFTNCYHLAEVNLPEGLTTLEECAFTFCIFESLEIPASLTSLDPMAFYKCGKLKDLTVAADNPMYCVYDGMVLSKDMTTVILGLYKYTEDVVIPDFVTRIGPSAFHENTGIKRLTIPASVDYIGKSAFTYCHSLEAVYLEDLADWCGMEIGAGLAGPMSYTDALYVNGEQITELVIPEGVERIAPYTFHQCRAFTSITLPDSVRRIEEAAFARCTKVTSLDLGNGVTFLGDEAFGACESLTELTIPASVTQMGDAAISYSKTLKKVTFLGDAPERVSGHIFSQLTAHAYYPYGNPTWTAEVMQKDFGGDITWVPYSAGTAIASGWSGETTWVLTDDGLLTFSGEGAMRNYKSKTAMPWYEYREQISGVVLGEGITCIGDYAFYGLPNLTALTIPATVTEIGDYAFKNCIALDGVVLPEALEQLGESAFYGCSALTAIDIPASLWTVQPYTFKNCTALAQVTFHEGNLQKISDAAFYNTAVVNVVLPDCLDILDAYVFKNCGRMRYVTLPAGLTEIREAAFYGSYLVGVNLPAGVTEVGAYAFKNCGNLHTVNLNEGLNTIGESAFYGCGTMYGVTVPEGVTAIGAYAFKKCGAMTTVVLPESLVTLGDSAFYGCDLVSEITLGIHVETVGDYCFAYSRTLRDITFTGDAPSIGSSAFKELNATVYYPGSNATWTEAVMQPYGGTITWTAR